MGLKEFTDGLHDEVVSEIAKKYFGTRKEIELLIEDFLTNADCLRDTIPALLHRFREIEILMLNESNLNHFWSHIDVPPENILKGVWTQQYSSPLPSAWTTKGKYLRSLYERYTSLQKSVDDYLNGRHFMKNGKKILSVHFVQLKTELEKINHKITELNSNLSLSDTLQFIKSMDPETAHMEAIMSEETFDSKRLLDRDLAFKPLNFNDLDLPNIQELPSPPKIKHTLKKISKAIYDARKTDVIQAMSRLAGDMPL